MTGVQLAMVILAVVELWLLVVWFVLALRSANAGRPGEVS
jgi:hypothetical protein